MKTLMLVLMLGLVSCGKASDPEEKTSASRGLETPGWVGDAAPHWIANPNLTHANQAFQWANGPGTVCECSLTVTSGNTSAGNYTITSCVFNPYSDYSGADPGCSSYQTTGTYTCSGGVLTLCDAGNSCLTYH